MKRLVPCALLVLAACGGNSSGGGDVDAGAIDAVVAPPDATPVVTLDDICGPDGVYNQLVAKLVGCNPFLDLILFQGQATPTAITALCHGAIDPYHPATIDLPSYAELQACLAYVSGTACLDLDFNASPCNLLHGTVADAMGCDTTEQCLDGSYCDRPNGNACGTCKPREADGLACTADEQCANGKCVGTQCGHPGQDGDPCVLDAQGNSDDCLGQRRCNAKTHLCETKVWQLNETCASLGECGIGQTDLYCKIPQNAPAGQCAHYQAVGDVCGGNSGLCDLRSYQWCNAAAVTPRCTDPAVVQDGAACGVFMGKKCAAGLVCSDPVGKTGGTCYAPGKKDATCGGAGDPPCGAFLACVSGKCEYTDDTPACP